MGLSSMKGMLIELSGCRAVDARACQGHDTWDSPGVAGEKQRRVERELLDMEDMSATSFGGALLSGASAYLDSQDAMGMRTTGQQAELFFFLSKRNAEFGLSLNVPCVQYDNAQIIGHDSLQEDGGLRARPSLGPNLLVRTDEKGVPSWLLMIGNAW